VIGVLEDGREAGAFDVIDVKLTAYAIIAQASHVGTWYQAGGRLSLEEVTAAYVGLALRMVAAEPVAAAALERLVSETRAFHGRP
jgi:hypothetical protein